MLAPSGPALPIGRSGIGVTLCRLGSSSGIQRCDDFVLANPEYISRADHVRPGKARGLAVEKSAVGAMINQFIIAACIPDFAVAR